MGRSDSPPPISTRFGPRELPRIDYLTDASAIRNEYLDDYADWFLYQLLARQLDHYEAGDWATLREWAFRRSYKSYMTYGEEIFD